MYFKFVTKYLERLGVVSCQISYKVLVFTFSHVLHFTLSHICILSTSSLHVNPIFKMQKRCQEIISFTHTCDQLCSLVSNAFPAATNPYTKLFPVLSPNQENFIYVSNVWHILHVQYLLGGYQCLPTDTAAHATSREGSVLS